MPDIQTPPVGTEEEKVTPDSPETPTPNPEPEAPELPDQPPAPDYERKFKESSREVQILREQDKLKDARIKELTKQHPPTDEELRQAYPEWETLLPHEQRTARENLMLRKKQAATDQRLAEIEAQRAWERDLASARKQYPALVGQEDEFEQFALKPSHRSTPIDILAKAFLSDKPAPPAPATPAPTPTRPGIQRGSGGPKAPVKGSKWTGEQMLALEKSDPAKYREMLLAGEFDD